MDTIAIYLHGYREKHSNDFSSIWFLKCLTATIKSLIFNSKDIINFSRVLGHQGSEGNETVYSLAYIGRIPKVPYVYWVDWNSLFGKFFNQPWFDKFSFHQQDIFITNIIPMRTDMYVIQKIYTKLKLNLIRTVILKKKAINLIFHSIFHLILVFMWNYIRNY